MTNWTKDFFRTNRQKLAKRTDGGLVVLAGYVEVQRRGDMAQPFSQESNMWYLTGIEEPGWRLIYDGARDHCWLVRPEVDTVQQIFDGSLSDQDALDISGADEIVRWADQELLLRQLARKHSTVYAIDPKRIAGGASFIVNPAQGDVHAVLTRVFSLVSDISVDLADQRAIKTPAEIDAIKKAVNMTVQTFRKVKSKLETFNYEYEIEAEFSYAFRRDNFEHAYDPIVASGKNACTLHYVKNTARRQAHSAALIDIGAQHNGYCADITRTYAWGKPTKRLRDLHQALESAQSDIVRAIAPAMPLVDYQQKVDEVMKKYMVEVGLLNDSQDARYRQYFPHAISHGLGVDVHDSLGSSRTLDPGMVLTVEPGIYVAEEGIGLRIEDDIVITDDGVVNLSAKLSTSLVD